MSESDQTLRQAGRRIEQILHYIEEHLDQPLTVESLASRCYWSRWQFQRVFSATTGMSVAQYVRTIRLGRAAEMLLDDTPKRHLEIALACGFDSEVSFNRAFRQMFDCTPGNYRKQGLRVGIRTPLRSPLPLSAGTPLLQIRLETRPAFQIQGLTGEFRGLLYDKPDFATKVPALWERFVHTAPERLNSHAIGVIDTTQTQETLSSIPYWAAIESDSPHSDLTTLHIPTQTYAVVPHTGPVANLHNTIRWFISHWLPDSAYQCIHGYELEVYGQNYDPFSEHAYMEYWMPVTP